MSVSQLSDKNVGNSLGLAYLSDIVAGGGVASINYINGATPVLLTGAVNLQSADSSVLISSGGANTVDFSANLPYAVYTQKSITVEGSTQQLFNVVPDDNGSYFYFTSTTTGGGKNVLLNFDVDFPVNGRIFVRNAGDSALVLKMQINLNVSKNSGTPSPIVDITDNNGALYSSNNGLSNSPWLVIIQTSDGVFSLF